MRAFLRIRRSGNRRGVAVLVVLLLISVALAISYATMRSQATVVQIQHNAGLSGGARQAAITGLTVALRKMHDADWAGVDSTLTGSLGSTQGYSVTFTAGDPSLTAGDSDYSDLPYRVTLVSVGYAADVSEPTRKATHTARAVVRLIPRKLPAEPSDWARMQQYTVYQTYSDPFEVDVPCRLSGRVRVQGKLKFATHYPNDSDAWWTYLRDLERMRQSGRPDYRPFTGPIDLPYVAQDSGYLNTLWNGLGVSTSDLCTRQVAADWIKPAGLNEYQLFSGGPVYAVQSVPDTLANVTLEPDPATNPLGLFCREGNLTIRDNVTIQGTLVCRDAITIAGSNVHIRPLDLPSLYGSDVPLRLPVATCQRFCVAPTAGGSLDGLLAVFDDFTVEKGPETTSFAVTGRVITRKLYVKERQPWETVDWRDCYTQFYFYTLMVWPGSPFFPSWMANRGRDPQPRVTIAPASTPVSYHWHKQCDVLYIPHPDDASGLAPDRPGLRWDLLEWKDGL